ncbi:MAG: isoprenoid biosynthesis glyoxalase ElbB [Chlorobium sp.]|uniref:isoprenoid biosynthesis glyoxalase ElbB n=1 Tax=Chlorobium sp. TaxID=1095 RepID=UPI0025BAB32E|nr:isoprenoid biosynthesis glyoxalase ElbB [Chlorobium sp.]MCF8382468.1 isoprenoid biosynthesis glyoxalase ElbB [Chlorobium sp.]
MKKIGVILSGCGFLDGAEIQEAVLTLLAIERAGAEAVCLAPDIVQHHVVNHLTGEIAAGETRNVLVESARIARGTITDLKLACIDELDALVLPGGYGAAKNLSDFAFRGADCKVNPDVKAAVQACFVAGKPLGFICIAPVIAARVLGSKAGELTIGNDPETARTLEAMGAHHIDCPVWNTVVSSEGAIVSTPAWMLGPSVGEVSRGIEKLVGDIVALL